MPDEWLQKEDESTARSYRVSSWWIRNRGPLKRLLIGAGFAVELFVFLFIAWTFIDAFLVSYTKEHRAIGEMAVLGYTDSTTYRRNHEAAPLTLGVARSLPASIGSDMYVEITNPNTEWYATLRYRFVWAGGTSKEETGFILPGESKPFVVFGETDIAVGQAVRVELLSVDWQRIDTHVVGAYETFRDEHLRLPIEDVSFSTDVSIEGKTIGVSSFVVANQTGFNFYQPGFFVVLYRGNQVVGVNKVVLDALAPGDRRTVEVRWFGTLPAADRSTVIPDIQIFSQEAYQALQ